MKPIARVPWTPSSFAGRRRVSGDLERSFAPGDPLASGAMKDVFEVAGQPERVIAIEKLTGTVAHELKAYAALEQVGVPTPEIVAWGELGSGQDALVLKRYEASSKDPDWDVYATEKTDAQLRSIGDRIDAAGLWVEDLQFLIDASGNVVVFDPFEVTQKSGDISTYDWAQQLLDLNRLTSGVELSSPVLEESDLSGVT